MKNMILNISSKSSLIFTRISGKHPVGVPQRLKQKKTNKSINKQTNKHTNKQTNTFLDPIYLSQIKSDLHEIFRVYSCGCPKMIKINKNKSIKKQTNKQINK